MATKREDLLRTLRRKGFEQVPVYPNSFCLDQLEAFRRRFGHEDYQGWFGSPCRSFGIPAEQEFTDWRKYYRHEELPPDTTFSVTGVGHSHQPGCFHMTRMHHPLKGEDLTADEIRNYPWPRFRPDAEEWAKSQVAEIQRQGLAAMASMACTIWEGSWYMRSMEDLMVDMMSEDERAVALLDQLTEQACEKISIAARAGADLVQTGDDIGMQQTPMMSVELWRQWLKPRFAKVIAAARSIKPDLLVFYHSCGFVLPFLEELIEIGVDILNPVQPECMKFGKVHEMVGGRMSFWGTIGTQTTLPFGTPDEVRAAVHENLRTCGKQGGIVIGPTHVVEPEVPWENLVAMKEACEEFAHE